MKIEEVLSLYEFIGNTSYWGLLGLILFASPIIIATLHFLLKDTGWTSRTKNSFVILSWLFFVVALGALNEETKERKHLLYNANRLKSYLVGENWKLIGYKRIGKVLGNDFDANLIDKIITAFPEEFIKVSLISDSNGIKLVDEKATVKIDLEVDRIIPYAKEKIRYYMETNKLDSISYQTILNKIDEDFNMELLDRMQAKYDTLFTPINMNGKMDTPGLKIEGKQ